MRRDRALPVLLALSLGLLVSAWVIGNPPSAAPDEAAHYVKALGVGGGDFIGTAVPADVLNRSVRSEASALAGTGMPSQEAFKLTQWQWLTSRVFAVPAHSVSSAFECNNRNVNASWSCLSSGHSYPSSSQKMRSYIGSYPPFDYLVPGLLARTGGSPDTRLLLARGAMAALALALLIAAVLLIWDEGVGALSLIGLVVAVTPMVVFVSATLSASGPEIAAAVCFVAALLRLSRENTSARWVWAMAAFSGLVLASSRQLGPEEIVILLVGTTVLLGKTRTRRLFRGRAALTAWLVVVVGCVASVLWDLAYGVHPPEAIGSVAAVLPSAVKQLGTLTSQAIGNFGWLDSPLPTPALVAWLAMLAVLLVIAVRLSGRQVSRRLGLIAVGIAGCTVALEALQRQTGFSFQGRYALPIFILLPMAAGELIRSGSGRLSSRSAKRLIIGTMSVAGLVQAVGWVTNGRRVAVGTHGSWLYAFQSQWHPPLGWLPWTVLVIAALVMYVVVGFRGGRAYSLTAADHVHPAAISGAAAHNVEAGLNRSWTPGSQALQSADA
jgi:hypothetical protein